MIFVDTSGFVAAFDANDTDHPRVRDAWLAVTARRKKLVTTYFVFSETVTYLRRRGGWKVSRKVGTTILQSSAIQLLEVDSDRLGAAWREFTRSGDPKLSLCDAASFIVMRELGIEQALTLDNHFREAGFVPIP